MVTKVETGPQGRSARGRPRRFNYRRDEVLRASARVFSEYGFRHATLEDVAHSLGVSRPALYHYAKSKDELLAQCAMIAQTQLHQAVEEALAEASGLDQINVFFRRYAEIICDDFGRCFVLTDRRELNPAEEELTRLAQRDLGAAVQAMMERGIADGSIRRCDTGDAVRALFGAFNSLPRWHHPKSGRTPADVARSFMHLVGEGLRAPAHRPAGSSET